MKNIFRETIKNAEIMLVDDSLEDLQMLVNILMDKGYKLRPANSGELALVSIKAKRPDLILLDVRMPDIDGYDVCRKIKADPYTQKIPLIFLYALEEVKDRVKGFEVGGTDFIMKPYQPEEVLARVNNQLEILYLQQVLEKSNQAHINEMQQRKKTEFTLYNERELLRTTLLSIGDGVICTDNNSKVTMINEVAKILTGWYEESAIGNSFEEVFNIINGYTREKIENLIKKDIDSGKVVGLANNTILVSRNGIERPIADSVAPIRDSEGKAIGLVLVFRDVTNEKIRQKEIELLSYHDQLTGLYNRRFFEEELLRLNTKRRLPLTLVMGDINGLKLANDAFGHSAGDELLIKAAQIIKQCAREDDIICRYGGDEFIIILPNTDSEAADSIIKRILTLVSQSKTKIGLLSISFGWDTKKEEEEDILLVLKRAEDYMYKHKLLESQNVRVATIQTIINTLYEISYREEAHSKRVSELCVQIGKNMNLSEIEISNLRTAGLLHDIGKIALSSGVLDKPGKLSDSEWIEIKSHPEIGYRILNSTSQKDELTKAILEHHERWDGKGYPKGLYSNLISQFARIITVADAYDAMISDRSYRKAMSKEDAILEIKKNAGTQFDPQIALIFVDKVLLNMNSEC